jgi:hypothetical protein
LVCVADPVRMQFWFWPDIQLGLDDGRIPAKDLPGTCPALLPSDVHQSVQTHARLGASTVQGPQQADDSGGLRLEKFKIADRGGRSSRPLRSLNIHRAADLCFPLITVISERP